MDVPDINTLMPNLMSFLDVCGVDDIALIVNEEVVIHWSSCVINLNGRNVLVFKYPSGCPHCQPNGLCTSHEDGL